MFELSIRSAATDYISFILQSGDDRTDLTSIDHLEFHATDQDGKVYDWSTADASPKVVITDADDGTVDLRPAATDFLYFRSPYRCHFQVYETSVLWYSVPENEEFIIRVRED